MTNTIKIKKTMTEKQPSQKATELNDEQIETNDMLQEELDNCKIEVAEWKDKFVRLNADFENFKKRTLEQQRLWIGTAQAEILTDLLTVIDNFERALTEHEKQEKTPESKAWIEGFTLIYQSLVALLDKFGVEEITQHDTFNPTYHEALVQVDSPDHEAGSIVEVMQKGYRFKDKVLRPAKVSVAK